MYSVMYIVLYIDETMQIIIIIINCVIASLQIQVPVVLCMLIFSLTTAEASHN